MNLSLVKFPIGCLLFAVVASAATTPTTTTLSVLPTPAQFGSSVTLTATVTGASSPTGKVTFYNGSDVLGVATIASGQAIFTTSALPTSTLANGKLKLRAYYQGNATNDPSSGTFSLTVSALPSTGFQPTVDAAPPHPNNPDSLATADFNGDGILDIVANCNGQLCILLGAGNGKFTMAPGSPIAVSLLHRADSQGTPLAVGDFNQDGKPDVAAWADLGASNGIQIFLGTGTGAMSLGAAVTVANTVHIEDVVVADFDGDGLADYVVLNQANADVLFFKGAGDGTFAAAVTSAAGASATKGLELVVGDFNNDNKPDLAMAAETPGARTIVRWTGAGDGTFTIAQTFALTNVDNMTVGDFNGDGVPDIISYSHTTDKVTALLNNGTGTFTIGPATTTGLIDFYSHRLTTGDFDGDGFLDLLSSDANAAKVHLGNGDGTFDGSAFTLDRAGSNAQGLAVGDFNGDQRTDVAIADTSHDEIYTLLGGIPIISSLSPPSTVAGIQGFTLTINGLNFRSGQTVKWTFGVNPVQTLNTVVNVAGTQMTVAIGNSLVSAVGTVSLFVSDPNGASSVPATYTIGPPPSVTSVFPTTAAIGGQSLLLTVNGQNFAPTATLKWQPAVGSAQILSTTVNGPGTQLTATIPGSLLGTLGGVTVSVVDPTGVGSNTSPFTVLPAPVMTSLSPTSIASGSPTTVLTINGSSFTAGDVITWQPQGGSAQSISGALINVNQSGTVITVQVLSNLLTSPNSGVQISVTDPDGVISAPLSLPILGPAITSLNPTSVGTNASDFSLLINGQDFVVGATAQTSSMVQFVGPAGTQTLPATNVSFSTLTVTVPGALIGKVPGTANVSVLNPPFPGGAVSSVLNLPVAPPTVSGINPLSGAAGGNLPLPITIAGTNFVSGSTVLFCNNCANNPTAIPTNFSTSTLLTATIPPQLLASPGTATLRVTNDPVNPNNPSTLSSETQFTISALVLSAISPSIVLAGSPNFNLTLTGQNFGTGAVVLWTGQASLVPTAQNLTSTQIVVTVPASYVASAGAIQVQVQNPNGAVSPPLILTIQQLAISNLAPSSIVAGSPTLTMNLTGTAFAPTTQVQWSTGGAPTSLSTTFIDTQHLAAVVPPNLVVQAGTSLVTAVTSVPNLGGTTAQVASAPVTVTIDGPLISAVDPSVSAAGVPTFALQVSGLNFLSGSVVQWNGGSSAQSIPTTFVSPTNLTALVPAAQVKNIGTALITVVNPGVGGASSNAVVFQIGPAPTILTTGSGLSPSTKVAGSASFQLQVSGTNYQSLSVVHWTANGTTTTLVSAFIDGAHLTANVPANLIALPGTALIEVLNPDGTASNGALFTIAPGQTPTLTSFSPSAGVTAGNPAFQLDVTGTNFVSPAVVQWTTTSPGATPQALSTVFVDASHLSAVVPANLVTTAGSVVISVLNSGGSVSNSLLFPVTATPPAVQPVISSLDQSLVTSGLGPFTLGINGQNFVASSVVQWNAGSGPAPLATLFVSATRLTALIPANLTASAGTAFVNVQNPGNNLSNSVSFAINPPAAPAINVNGLSPSTITAGSAAFQLTVSGTNFTSGSAVQWNSGAGPQPLPTIFVDSTHLTLVVPATLVAVPGTAFLNVQNPGGITSGLVSFTVTAAAALPAPVISGSPVPASASAGGSTFQLTVNGSNFLSGAVVLWSSGAGAAQALSTVFVNSGQVTALVTSNLIATAGTAFISVQNPGGVTSNVVQFSINASPSIAVNAGLQPASANAGVGAFQMIVTGSNFVAGSLVQWNSGVATTTLVSAYVNQNQLTAIVPAALVSAAGNAFVTVVNPGNLSSNLVTFTINPPPAPTQPTINASSGLAPAAAVAGGAAFQLSIAGTNFINGSVVQWDTGSGAQALTTAFLSSTALVAQVPASFIASAGSAFISVLNPSTALSNIVVFPVNPAPPAPPAISAGGLSPPSVTAGSPAFLLVVTGTNFVSGSTVQFTAGSGSPQQLSTTFLNGTSLSALVPGGLIASPGTAFVGVVNPGGQSSGLVAFTINAAVTPPAPVITSPGGLNPAAATAGGGTFQLSVSGSNFLSGAVVQWNPGSGAQALVTTFLSATSLTAVVPGSLIAGAGSVFVTVLNPGNVGSNAVSFSVDAVPTISNSSGLAPSSVVAGSGAFQLVVTGTNYANGSVVQWNSGSGPQPLVTSFVNQTQVTAIVPANLVAATGSAFVSVQNAGGATSNLATFTISAPAAPAQPTINASGGLTPATAVAGGSAFQLVVLGTNFVASSVVQWSGGSGPLPLATTFVNSTQLVAQVTAGLIVNTGNALVTVQNPGNITSNVITFVISTPPPSAPLIPAGGLNPASATAGGSPFPLVVTGANFGVGSIVLWNSGSGTPTQLSTVFVSPTQLSALVPGNLIASPGTAFVSVQNNGGLSSNLVGFTINPQASPAITAPGGLMPASVTVGGAAFQLTISGANFVPTSQVQWNTTGPQPLQTSYVNATQLTAVVPANLTAIAGTAFVNVLNPGGLLSNLVSFPITAVPTPSSPTILTTGGLVPSSALAGGPAIQIGVTGTNFVSGSVVKWVAGGAPQTLTTGYVSATQLTALVPAALVAAPGSAFVSVENPGVIGSNLVVFAITAVPAPSILASGGLSPASAATGINGVLLTVTGNNFFPGSVAKWNAGAGPTALTTGFVSSTQLSVIIPPSLLVNPATVLITVVNPDASTSNAVTFFVVGSGPIATPALASIAPTSAAAGSATLQLAVTGANFTANTGGGTNTASIVLWNGSPLTTTFVSATQLNAQVDASLLQAAGSNFVTVINGNVSSTGVRFQVNPPTLSAVAPSSVTAGGATFTMTLTGTNFVAGSVAVWNGSNLSTTVNSATQLTALVPASLIANSGTAFVLVTNPGGASSSPAAFTISTPNAPVISSLNPPSAVAGGAAFQLTVTGSGFVSGSVVNWNGSPIATGFLSSTQVTALIDSTLTGAAGTANVTVQNPGAPSSATIRFAINGPSITTLSPTTVNAGGPAFTLTVTGANFVPGTAVLWNGNALPSAYLGSTQVTANVAASLVVSQTAASVAVQNPGGAVSASVIFNVGPTSLRITTTSLPDGVVGTFYSRVLSGSGGDQPYNWTVSGGNLPDGISLDAPSGTISGTPTGAANISLTVTLTDSLGRTASQTLQLRVALVLSVTTISPLPPAIAGSVYSTVLAATGGTPPYLWSLAGALPSGLNLNVATGEISGAAVAPGGYHFTVSVVDSRQQQTVSKAFDLIVSVASLTVGGPGANVGPAQQVPITVTLSSPYTTDLTGSLTLTFVSAVGGDDPSLGFTTGGRTVSFTIPAGNTQASFGQSQQLLLSTGTVSGTISIKASLKSGSSDITPLPAPQLITTVPKQAPVITDVQLTAPSTGGVLVGFTAYSTTKEVTQVTFQFNPATGSTLTAAAPITVSIGSTIAAWYQTAASGAFGSQFTISFPFNIQGDVRAIGSVTVTLTNAQGVSAPFTALMH